ncbi:MAG: GntR family transcriptional regulator [Lentisphaeria bacterium]|nr:GntR family transcriptional regulator [Lentisphaeria bacterium]
MNIGSLAQTAYQELLARLLDGRLRPGDVIDRKALARELGMSMSPVMEALGQLAGEGMVEILPRRGTRVRTVTGVIFREQIIFRTALEAQAARLYCGGPVRAARERLRELCDRIEGCAYGPELWRAEAAFHLALAELSGVAMLVDALRSLLRFSHFAASHLIIPEDDHHQKHHGLLTALCTDDPDAAATAIRQHMALKREAVLRRGATKEDVIL